MRNSGRTLQFIADELNRDGIPTAAGKPEWQRPHVHRILGTAVVAELREELALTEDMSTFGGEMFPESGDCQAA